MKKRNFHKDGRMASNLWLDGSRYQAKIAQKLSKSLITSQEAIDLEHFAEQGYMIINPDLDDKTFEVFDQEVNSIWHFKPCDAQAAVTGIAGSRPQPMSALPDGQHRKPGTRLLDIHSHSVAARDIILKQSIHRYIDLILGQKCVATQSLYFEYGSTQAIHRDPWFVVTKPPSHMLAIWIALEDIDQSSGPLVIIPKSHRLPFHVFNETDGVVFHHPSVTADMRKAGYAHLNQLVEQQGLKAETFLPKKGQALIWHSGLAHGGSAVENPNRTRKSFVVHFDAKDGHPSHAQRVQQADGSSVVYRTKRLLKSGNNYAYDSALRVTQEQQDEA